MASRLDRFFADEADGLCHVDYWGSLADIWRSADAGVRTDPRWRDVWERARLAPGAQRGLMRDDERAALAALPATVALAPHPGGSPFAWRLDGDAARTVQRDDIVALFLVDGAPEVVVPPAGA